MVTAALLQVFGLLYLAIGLVLLVHPAQFKKSFDAIAKSSSASFVVGILMLILGSFLIVLHSLWSTPEEILVSVIGWGAFFKGICYLGFPEVVNSSIKFFIKSEGSLRFMGGLVLLLGIGLYTAGLI